MTSQRDHRPISKVIRHQPVTLQADATVREACATMHRERIGAIMVVDAEARLQGIFTGRDAVRLLAEGKNPARALLHEVMTRDPCCMPPTHSAIHALRLMSDGGFRHVPVVEDGRVVGLVSHGDFRHHELARLDEETGYWERL
jgi:CBS domain-containing protein